MESENSFDDYLIDQFLFSHINDEPVSVTVKRLGFADIDNLKLAFYLQHIKLFRIYGAPDYLEMTRFGKEVRAKGGWLKYNRKPLFDRILQNLFELQDSGTFHNLFELFLDADKDAIRNKAKELQRQKLIEIKQTGFYTTVIGHPKATPADIENQRQQREAYNNQLNAKITWEGIQYCKGNQVASIVTTVHDQSTHQNISGNTIHGPVNQSSDSSTKLTSQPSPSQQSFWSRIKNTIAAKTIGIIIAIAVGLITAYLIYLLGLN